MRGFLCTCLAGLGVAAALASDTNGGSTKIDAIQLDNAIPAPIADQFPGVRFMTSGGRVTTLYGTEFAFGASPEDTAATFISENAQTFAAGDYDLSPVGPTDGRHTQGLMYDKQTGEPAFTLVYFTQEVDGIPVFRSDVRLLVKNEPGYPLVLANSQLRDVQFYAKQPVPLIDDDAAVRSAIQQMPDVQNVSDPELVIFAGTGDETVAPRLALAFYADNGLQSVNGYHRMLYVADAATGAIIFAENQVHNGNVTGTVSGNATQGDGPDFCGAESSVPMPYAKLTIGATTAYADANGAYSISDGGAGSVTVNSTLTGNFFKVVNLSGASASINMTVAGGGVANFLHNAANTSEFNRSEVNVYLHANVVRDYLLSFIPNYPTIAGQTNFTANVNTNATCNAFYDGVSINFYKAGGGCPNTGYSNVVYHEYGHHIVASGGSGQGAYGEGMGDSMGVIIQDRPETGLAFLSPDCNSSLRTADNTKQYPCSGEIHDCGQLISGCIWSTRNQMVITEPVNYQSILSNIVLNSIPLHTGDAIDPSITATYHALDGTAHYNEIETGFAAHSMGTPMPITCADITGITLKCGSRGRLSIGVTLTDTTHAGQTIGVSVDGGPMQLLSVKQNRAKGSVTGGSGTHTVTVVDPPGCGVSQTMTCP